MCSKHLNHVPENSLIRVYILNVIYKHTATAIITPIRVFFQMNIPYSVFYF